MADNLTDDATRHWSGVPQPLIGLIRIDGKTLRWMGGQPKDLPAIKQTAVEITPTRTVYRFEEKRVRLEVTFFSPLLASDLDVLSRPITYVAITCSTIDGMKHQVQVLFEASSDLALNSYTEDVTWSRLQLPRMTVLRASNFEQPVLEKSGDDLRIDWGYLLLALPDQPGSTTSMQLPETLQSAFVSGTSLPPDEAEMPQRGDKGAVLAVAFDLDLGSATPVSRHLLLGYDDLYSIEYLHRWLRPYWRRDGMGAGELLELAERQYQDLDQRAKRFDDELTSDLRQVGGPRFAQLAALAYRQAMAAHKLAADVDGQPMFFPKENFSNGCISTVDVIYPSSALFLLLNP